MCTRAFLWGWTVPRAFRTGRALTFHFIVAARCCTSPPPPPSTTTTGASREPRSRSLLLIHRDNDDFTVRGDGD
ncbi:unnamed protein product [Pleuronectes platessa]|uniref:Secreted protein n=1 Tax=Pleuronectes platessa TaxID=8262 RepID=A0A9N7Z8S5_PLEPL|nr:unnamed protein product [Pleuronectes platessa]